MIERVMIAGGGTGGHLFPGLAVVEELRRRIPSVAIRFVGTERGIEARALPARGEEVEFIEVRPLKGRTAKQLAKNVAMLPSAGLRAMSIVRSFDPDVVIGVGGYASGPILAAAAALRVPTAILEQNAHLGMTNKVLSKVVGRAYLTWESTAAPFRTTAVRVVGNPVRRSFVTLSAQAGADPDGFEARAKHVLVVGGSQGAKALNETVPVALAKLKKQDPSLRVIHQTGKAMLDGVKARYEELGVDAEVVSFIDDMAGAFAGAKLVIARAGATTLAELAAVGRPSVLIPYPHAADNHQEKNASELQQLGAAVCLPERDLSADALADAVKPILLDQKARLSMARAARKAGRPHAAAAIVDDLCEWLGGPDEAQLEDIRSSEAPPRPMSSRPPEPLSSSDDTKAGTSLRGRDPYIPSRSRSRRNTPVSESVRPLQPRVSLKLK